MLRNKKYRIISLFGGLFLGSFLSLGLHAQKALHLDNKGLTCAAGVFNNDHFSMCGETAKFADRNSGTFQKDALVAIGSFAKDELSLYAMGDRKHDFRWEKLAFDGEHVVLSGYGYSSRNAVIASYSQQMELGWSLTSSNLKPFGDALMSVDQKGNILLLSSNPSSEAYCGTFTLFDPSGKVAWCKSLAHIDVVSDLLQLNGGNFLFHFKKKGAYFEAQNNKKYFINPSVVISAEGQVVDQFSFLIDREKYIDVKIHKVLESNQGNLFYLGSVEIAPHLSQMFGIKSDRNGNVLWSFVFHTQHSFSIKSADISDQEDIYFVADNYGQSGGILRGSCNTQGVITWNTFQPTSPYEQAIQLNIHNAVEYLFYDKIVNFAYMANPLKVNSCLPTHSTLVITAEDAGVIRNKDSAIFIPDSSQWIRQNFFTQSLGIHIPVRDCSQ